MNELISIVVPVYNVEKYLERCINSIIDQTYKNIEIILVDDGSTDNSPKICDSYLQKDSRVKVIHKENGGLSDARNVGIDKAKGQWISFIDSDDYISKFFIEKLYKAAIKTNALIAQCKFKKLISQEKTENTEIKEFNIVKKNYKEHLHNIDDSDNVCVCNKLFKKDLFNNIKFPKNRIHEDVATTYKLVYEAKNIAIFYEELYYYFTNPNSITTIKIKDNKLDLVEAYYEQAIYFNEFDDCKEFKKEAINRLVALFGTLISYNKERYLNYNDFYKKLTKKYIEIRPFIKKQDMRKDLKLLVGISYNNLYMFKMYHKIKTMKKNDT